MSLKENLLNLTKSSKNDKKELSVSELAKLREVLVEAMQKDAKNGLYKSELVLTKEFFPTIHYIYLDVLGFTDIYNGLTKLKYVLIHLLDLSLSIDVTKDKDDELVINVSWGYSLANDINNYLKIKDESNNLGY